MKFIHNILDKVEPIAKKSKFTYTLYDALHTLLFQPNFTTKGKVHIKDGMDLKRTMIHVVLALQLCYILGTYNIGHQHYIAVGLFDGHLFEGFLQKFWYGLGQLAPIFLVVHIVGLGIEILFAARKGHAVEEGFLVSGALLPLIMPPDIPLWMVGLATAFAVLIAKEAFGGTGMNILNVALTARVFIFFAFPNSIIGDSCWVAYDYNFIHNLFGLEDAARDMIASNGHNLDILWASIKNAPPDWIENPLLGRGWSGAPTIVTSNLLASGALDAWTGATPLGVASYGYENPATEIMASGGMEAVRAAGYSNSEMIWGFIPGSIGEMSKVGILFGAVLLLVTKIASWRIMLSGLLGLIATALVYNLIGGSNYMAVSWYEHLMMGSFLFAIVFMATDPVTASGTNTGKWIYGFFIGVVGMLIRVANIAYPEGWMLAILIMNVFAPLIDHYVLQGNIKRRLARVG